MTTDKCRCIDEKSILSHTMLITKNNLPKGILQDGVGGMWECLECDVKFDSKGWFWKPVNQIAINNGIPIGNIDNFAKDKNGKIIIGGLKE